MIIRIKEYTKDSAGVFKVTANTFEDLTQEIEKLYKEYPVNPYGTFVDEVSGAKGSYKAYVYHHGSD